MFDSLKQLLGLAPKTDFKQLFTNGAIILDVRTKGEFSNGHIKESINIPLDQLKNKLGNFIDKNVPVITCCASGTRSAMAKSILKSNGYLYVYNGGSWFSLKNKIS